MLSGWLHTTAHHLAIKTIRTDARRQQREKEAATMNESTHVPAAASWQEIAPHLDTLIGKLAESERDAILLRYFEKKSATEMAACLGISADAAQKRVNRAVEKLRNLFSKHGINIGAGGLGILISTHAVQAAPAGLALTISSVALAGTAATTSTLITATKTMAMTTLQKTLVTTTVAVLAGVGLYEAKQAHDARTEVQTLRQQQAPLVARVQELEDNFVDATNRLANLLAENASLKSNSERNELLKLRGEVTRLRSLEKDINALQKAASQSVSGLAEWRPNEVRNVGRATPLDAMQTFLWSEITTNLSVLSQCFVGDETDPVTPESLTQFASDPMMRLGGDLDTIRVLSQRFISPTEVLLDVQAKFDERSGVMRGNGVTIELTLHNVNGEWKFVVFNVRDTNGNIIAVSPGIKPEAP
ncbi:MAG: sigma-70 family RNA polymerase sigma factor [Verrucomicrobia bacterium]|nr:sigma-70 family RNA polymerase sigma factor [Verrucomicrobiota bacterium]